MKMGVSEVARFLEIDREVVKTWAFRFKDYLAAEANPPRGVPRQFCLADVQVLAYVSSYWEEDPDLDAIAAGLRAGAHQGEPYDAVVASITPLFQQPPEELDETWRHGALVGGLVTRAVDTFALADAYKLAGDVLVDAGLSVAESYELIYPIIYNYRHALELYLKAVVLPPIEGHPLKPLLDRLRDSLRRDHGAEIPAWFEKVILAIDDFDPSSTTFRYGDSGVISHSTGDGGEFWIDLHHMKKQMGWMAASFQKIRAAQR